MTREEAIARIKDHMIVHKMNEPRAIYISEALNVAIKALEQEESCDDAISRKAVYEQINSWNRNGEYSYTNATYYLMKRIRDIPSVTP